MATNDASPRFRLSIDFSARQPMLDFVELLKREEFLPETARARPIDPTTQMSAATETYVVVVPEAPS
jgi:hypothetical protein